MRGQLVLRGEDILPDQRGAGGVSDGFGRHNAGAQSGERCGADADDHRVEITRPQTGVGDGAGDVALESFDMGARIGFDDRLATMPTADPYEVSITSVRVTSAMLPPAVACLTISLYNPPATRAVRRFGSGERANAAMPSDGCPSRLRTA